MRRFARLTFAKNLEPVPEKNRKPKSWKRTEQRKMIPFDSNSKKSRLAALYEISQYFHGLTTPRLRRAVRTSRDHALEGSVSQIPK